MNMNTQSSDDATAKRMNLETVREEIQMIMDSPAWPANGAASATALVLLAWKTTGAPNAARCPQKLVQDAASNPGRRSARGGRKWRTFRSRARGEDLAASATPASDRRSPGACPADRAAPPEGPPGAWREPRYPGGKLPVQQSEVRLDFMQLVRELVEPAKERRCAPDDSDLWVQAARRGTTPHHEESKSSETPADGFEAVLAETAKPWLVAEEKPSLKVSI